MENSRWTLKSRESYSTRFIEYQVFTISLEKSLANFNDKYITRDGTKPLDGVIHGWGDISGGTYYKEVSNIQGINYILEEYYLEDSLYKVYEFYTNNIPDDYEIIGVISAHNMNRGVV